MPEASELFPACCAGIELHLTASDPSVIDTAVEPYVTATGSARSWNRFVTNLETTRVLELCDGTRSIGELADRILGSDDWLPTRWVEGVIAAAQRQGWVDVLDSRLAEPRPRARDGVHERVPSAAPELRAERGMQLPV